MIVQFLQKIKIVKSCSAEFEGLLGVNPGELGKIDNLDCIVDLVSHVVNQVYALSLGVSVLGIVVGGFMYFLEVLKPGGGSYDKPKKYISGVIEFSIITTLISLIINVIVGVFQGNPTLFPRI